MANCNTPKQKRILYGVLNWGLGHASRSVPVIQELLDAEFEVIIASDGLALAYLKKAFPQLKHKKLPSYNIQYSTSKHQLPKLLLQLPKIFLAIQRERRLCQKWAKELTICGVISDNRLGFRADGVPNVYLTHQLSMQLKYGNWLANSLHQYYFRKFSVFWIPDYENSPRLAGDLSKAMWPAKSFFLGALSHLSKVSPATVKTYRWAILLSGPEPLRSRLEQAIFDQWTKLDDAKVLLVRGKQRKLETANWANTNKNWEVHDFLTHLELKEKLAQSENLLSRLGYSTLMDLVYLQIPAVLIPTPGQPEQEYLALQHKNTAGITILKESELHLDNLPQLQKGLNFPKEFTPDWKQLFSIFM